MLKVTKGNLVKLVKLKCFIIWLVKPCLYIIHTYCICISTQLTLWGEGGSTGSATPRRINLSAGACEASPSPRSSLAHSAFDWCVSSSPGPDCCPSHSFPLLPRHQSGFISTLAPSHPILPSLPPDSFSFFTPPPSFISRLPSPPPPPLHLRRHETPSLTDSPPARDLVIAPSPRSTTKIPNNPPSAPLPFEHRLRGILDSWVGLNLQRSL